MKVLVVVFLALVAAVASDNGGELFAKPPPPVNSLLLGDLLKEPLTALVTKLVKLVADKILGEIPGKTIVDIQALIGALKKWIPNITVAQLIIALGSLLGKDLRPIAELLPSIVARAILKVPVLLADLIKVLPQGIKTPTATLAALLLLLAPILIKILVAIFVDFLNLLSK